MKTTLPKHIPCLAYILSLGLLLSTTQLPAKDADDTALVSFKEVVSNFYDALNDVFRGDSGPMLDVWSHAEDITFMGPEGGMLLGWEDIREEWVKVAKMKLGGDIRPAKLHYFMGEDLAVVQNFEIGENVDKEGKTVQVKIRVTSIFRMTDGAWKMISHQTDQLSFLQ